MNNLSGITYLTETTSTMDEMKSLARNGAKDGEVVVAEKQTSGRGRQGRSWFADEESLTFSILYRPQERAIDVAEWTTKAGQAVAKGITQVVKVPVRLEWPNDLIVDNEKIGGILIESASQGQSIDYIVVGVGINVNNSNFPDPIKQSASSLKQKAGKEIDKKVLLFAVIKELRRLK
ncbi:MAG: biotin--[acetyl-CoA-carboxylase] ligase [Candidatus Margulisiibacteriota bacterium]|jgi:BirA family biotin operon repressor/biotin-[acetyl-CoA-carboxylase] ligase